MTPPIPPLPTEPLAENAMLQPMFGYTLRAETENLHVTCDRTAINEKFAEYNPAGWALACQPIITGSHADLFFERTVHQEWTPPETAPVAEENPAASTEASPV